MGAEKGLEEKFPARRMVKMPRKVRVRSLKVQALKVHPKSPGVRCLNLFMSHSS